MAEQAGCALFS